MKAQKFSGSPWIKICNTCELFKFVIEIFLAVVWPFFVDSLQIILFSMCKWVLAKTEQKLLHFWKKDVVAISVFWRGVFCRGLRKERKKCIHSGQGGVFWQGWRSGHTSDKNELATLEAFKFFQAHAHITLYQKRVLLSQNLAKFTELSRLLKFCQSDQKTKSQFCNNVWKICIKCHWEGSERIFMCDWE